MPAADPIADDIEIFPPTLREVMLRPRWIAMLVLCLVVAGVFAWLGQWQLGRAIDTSPPPPGMTEEVRPLADVAGPGEYLPEPLVGQRVETSGSWVPGDFIVVSQRYNDGAEGYWVTGQLRLADTATPTSLAVAVGWTADRARADAAASALSDAAAANPAAVVELTGRLISDEGASLPPSGADPFDITRMSPPALLSRWHDIAGLDVYRPYLTSTEPLGGLEAISSPAPAEGSNVNWLNIFYAVEWAVFAGFAFYLWYRLAKDAWEKEVESLEEQPD
ncbi:SURF1 family cytochrome oxidase biogenesis protein [Microbacterium sp. 10M-3C3]|jgi:cytochrome oxidase assembly protein ShyY1|uniref:SURF1 family protein n=1 Tax=Microbacterium sp. 10M-3C3 TaxID=2483401 RepID=UPI001F0C56C9|nr:SURF1 family cytochrome oxidase biogenesis protein [Microbacterium sp. 10M-3C3]